MQTLSQRSTLLCQGEVKISTDPNEVLTTILGSCVATCLSDVSMRVGGMNHFLLPEINESGTPQIKYGAYAMELLINSLLKKGARKEFLVAKLFGGAALSGNLGGVGAQNIKFAKSYLAAEGVRCVSESLGGDCARRVKFWPTTGQAQLLMVPNKEYRTFAKLPAVQPPISVIDITLF